MFASGRCVAALCFLTFGPILPGASATACSQGARAFLPCELTFEWQDSDVPAGSSPYKQEFLNVEFRSPRNTTYLMHAFGDGGHTLRVRFTPTEPGLWHYHISGLIKRLNDQESTFTSADSDLPGFINVANVRHWWTMKKQPHLWLSASVPFFELDQPALEAWLDARKHDGFTHIRGTLLTQRAPLKPLTAAGEPNISYFQALDERVLAAADRGFILDLILADQSFVRSGAFNEWSTRDPLVHYLVARYAGLNVTWQGIEHFEDAPGGRSMLKEIGLALENYDSFHHPRSSDARETSSPLTADGWMNFIVEASSHPELAAVEHQFTQAPSIHIVQATDPEAFRHELWLCTTNGQYPTVPYAALQNQANAKVVQIWKNVISDTRHWEFEPYFDVDGARAVGLDEVEYVAYALKPGIVEITLPHHKYNPVWVNPITGEQIELKNYRGEIFNQQTPDSSHDWILQVPRDGEKASMLKFVRFESTDPPIQEPELDPAKTPFEITDPAGDEINSALPTPYNLKITRANRASRIMQYVWWGEIVAGGEGARVLGFGQSGSLTIPKELIKDPGSNLNIRLLAINANGKAYEVDRVYRLTP